MNRTPRRRLRNGRGPKPAKRLEAPNPIRGGHGKATLEDVLGKLADRVVVNAVPLTANAARPKGLTARYAGQLHEMMEDVTKADARTIAGVILKSHKAGLSPEETAEVLARSADLDPARALLVARTELARVAAEEARQGADKVRFTANADACPLCRKMHGKVYRSGKAAGKIPVHPGCHCTWEPLDKVENVDPVFPPGDDRARAVADILCGLFGANASRLVDLEWTVSPDGSVTENKFNPGQKRDARGRWTKGAGAGRINKPAARDLAYDQARATVRSFLTTRGKVPSPAQARRLSKALDDLTLPQLRQLADEHGLQAKGRAKQVVLSKLRDGLETKRAPYEKAKKEGQEPPKPTPPDPGPTPGGKRGRGTGKGSGGDDQAGGGVEGKPQPPGGKDAGGDGAGKTEPLGGGVRDRVPVDLDRANEKIDRMRGFLERKFGADSDQVRWMDQLKEHVNTVGVATALEGVGGPQLTAGKLEGGAQYEGGWVTMSDFAQGYLARNGISMVGWEPGDIDPAKRVVSSISPSFGSVGDTLGSGRTKDFFPKDPKLKDKLAEAKHLPGLEKSEDLRVLMGREKVTHLTPDVTAKLNDTYGEGKWIVKTYGDEAFAGNGIFFPQRAKQIQADAQGEIWASGGPLAQYGFKHHRDANNNVVGIEHKDGQVYLFGTKKYEGTIDGEVRHWADRAARAAPDEHGPALPFGGKDFMAQPAFEVVGISDADRARGVTIKPGEEGRVHLITRNGKTEIVPHTTWLKQQALPVVFETADTRAMAKAAKDAIDALPPSERQGQIYAADVVRTKDGYKVVEANPANNTGSSGYLGDNPLIIDSFVSHVTGRTPAHVRTVRQLLTERGITQNARKPKQTDANCGVGAGGFQPGNTCAGGGGVKPFSTGERGKALAALDKLPVEKTKDTQDDPTADLINLDRLRMGAERGKFFKKEGRVYAETVIDPKKVKVLSTQDVVDKKAVAEKISGDFKDLGTGKVGLPEVVKVGEQYHIQSGHHRAVAQLLARGEITALVTEWDGTRFALPGGRTANARKGKASPGGDCGTGSGGFKPGNTCGRGGGGAAGLHLGDTEPVSPREMKAMAKQVQAKVDAAPVPSKADVTAGREDLRKARLGLIRAGGEKRGNSNDRKVRAKALFREFGGEERGYVPCPVTGIKMHWAPPTDKVNNPNGYEKFEQGKIFTACQGGRYKLANLIPESFFVNRQRNDKPVRRENLKGC